MGGECGCEAHVRVIGGVRDVKSGLRVVDGTNSVDARHDVVPREPSGLTPQGLWMEIPKHKYIPVMSAVEA